MNVYQTKRERLEALRSQLDLERQSFVPHWRDLADYVLPRRSQFQLTDTNKGDRRSTKIIDSTATLAARTLSSGMMSGITSPARPWFRLTTPDPDMAESGSVKEWLHVVTTRMSDVFLRSNIYNILPTLYSDLGVFGTSPICIEEDFSEVVRGTAFPIGSYWIACDMNGRVNTFRREFRMSVAQILEKFWVKDESNAENWKRFSSTVKNNYDNGNYQSWIDVSHVIHPNMNYDKKRIESKFKKFESCYYEMGTAGASGSTQRRLDAADQNKYLRESGYDYFPILCPRWELNAGDVYATNCPGMVALGDIKQLQTGEKRGLQGLDKMINPPMKGPVILKTTKSSVLPGDMTYLSEMPGQGEFKPIYQVDFRIDLLEQKQAQVRDRIRRGFYEDLFLMLASSDRRQITAREIEERHEEKLLALGPVLEQLNQDLLDPLIDITFMMMDRQGLIPPPPEDIQGQDLKVEYVSIMSQAQKMVGIASIERFTGFVGSIVQVTGDPSTAMKVDVDQLIDVYGDAVGVSPKVIRSDEKVEEMRAEQKKAAQAQMQQAQMEQAASTAKNLSQADLEGDNALSRLEQMSATGL